MMILGIDPAISGPAGLCLYDSAALRFVDAAVLTYPRRLAWESRLTMLLALVEPWLAGCAGIAVEGAYLDRNAQTAIKLAHCAGALRGLAYARHVPFALVNPLETRAVLAGIPAAMLAGVLRDIRPALQDHAMCAAAIALHGAGLLRQQEIAT